MVQAYDFPANKRDEFIATKREQHEVSEGFAWKSKWLAEMRPEIAAAYRMGFTIASERFQPYPVEWDTGQMSNAWKVQGIHYRWWMLAVPHWFVTLGLMMFPALLIVVRVRRKARKRVEPRAQSTTVPGGPGGNETGTQLALVQA
jgi:hypothetical protein